MKRRKQSHMAEETRGQKTIEKNESTTVSTQIQLSIIFEGSRSLDILPLQSSVDVRSS